MPPWRVKTGKSKTLIMYLYEIALPLKKKVLRLTDETQPSCSTDCWSLSRSQQLFFCLFHFSVLQFSSKMSISSKRKKTHTRQELISPAANSHSRWSIFPPFKMKGQNESSDLIRGPRWNRAHEIVFSFRRFTLSLCISLLLLYFIYPSFDLSTSNSLCLHKAPPLRLMKSSPWLDPILDYIRFLGARFSRVIFHTRLFRPSFLI